MSENWGVDLAIAKIVSLAPAILLLAVSGVNVLDFYFGDDEEAPPPAYHQSEDSEDETATPAAVSAMTSSHGSGIVIPYYILYFLGAVYLPMALLACVLFRTAEVLNPVFVFGSIAKVRSDYVPVYIVMMVSEFMMIVGSVFASLGVVGALAGPILVSFIWLYLMMIQMRVLGELYCVNRNRLAWFAKKT